MTEYIETPFTPDEFTEFAKTRNEYIVLGVNIGIEIEVRSRAFYQSVIKKLPPGKKLVLKFLANEELDHLKTLIAFKTALEKNGKWIELSKNQLLKIRPPKLYVGKGSAPFIKEAASDSEIILAAMKAEKRSEQFYNRIGKKVKDLNAKSFFGILAKFERSHYNLLKGLL